MKYQAILFDMDGVIVDSEPLHKRAHEETFKQYDIVLTDEDFKTHILSKTELDGLNAYLKHINRQIDPQEFMRKRAVVFSRLMTQKIEAYPGMIEMIRDLSNQVPLALVTNSRRANTDQVLQMLEIDDCFDIIVTSDSVENGKPDPEGYVKAMSLLLKQPEECVIVEDSPTGVTAANEAGIYCIAVTNTHTAAELNHAGIVVDKITKDLFLK